MGTICPDISGFAAPRAALWHSCLDERPKGARPGTGGLVGGAR
jgi:hypothetical protein